MKQRKTMKLWQMLVLVILLVGLLVTIFLPAYHFNGKAIVKMYESSDLISMAGAAVGMDMDTIREEADEEIQKIEEEYGIKLSNITPGRIMTHSAESFWGEAYEEMEEAEVDMSGYTTCRVLLWIIYMLALVVILLLILGFCLKWTKYITLTISTVYGLFVAVIFGIWQFISPGAVAKNANLGELMGEVGLAMGSQQGEALTSMMKKLISNLMGVAFLIGFIVALLFVIMSVVSLFVGGPAKVRVDIPNDDEQWRRDQAERERQAELERQRRAQEERAREERERQKQREREEAEKLRKQQAAQAAAMGQVVCTKGIAVGQGFSLPEDRKVVVGRSTQKGANLVINDPHISNVHCSIRYKAATRTYIVKDHSSTGTFVNGVRLQKDVAMTYPAGTVLQLADGKNEITLG